MRLRSSVAALTAATLGLTLVAAGPGKAPTDRPGKGGRPPAEEPVAPALAPTDYIALEGERSQPDYPVTIRETMHVPSWDGTDLYVEIVRPDPAVYPELDDLPIVMEASPYHGTIADRDGTRIFPDPVDEEGTKVGLTGFFAPRGYAVAIVDLRGTGRSGGCLDHLGPNDARDLEFIIEWLAGQEWSNGRVGMTGHSYVGSTPSVAAAMRPEGLATIVPSAGLASMYDHQFQAGVPYFLQWVGPQVAYEALALDRHLPPEAPSLFGETGDDFGNHPTDTGCGLKNSALLAGSGQVTGQYELWHAMRDWRDGAAEADIPVFMIHGVNDNAARIPAAEWFFGRRFERPGDKVWVGQWDHGSTNGRCGETQEDGSVTRVLHPTCRFDQFVGALHAWFDFHLKGMDVETGPAVEAFLNGDATVPLNRILDPESEEWGRGVFVSDAWRHPGPGRVVVAPDAASGELLLGDAPDAPATATFSNGANAVIAHVGAGSVSFLSQPLAEETLFLGLPRMELDVALTTGQITHLVATLNRVTLDESGAVTGRQPMNYCAIQPQLRHGVHDVAPVVPGERMKTRPTCFTMAHRVPEGQAIELVISTRSPHHASFAGTDAQITVFTGPDATGYLLPQVPDAEVHDDVPLRADGTEEPRRVARR